VAQAESSDGIPVAIVWQAPATCPSSEQVRAELKQLLAHAHFLPDAPIVTANATVSEHGGRFAATVQLESQGSSDSKMLEADGCAALADAYAVIIAFAVDPSVGRFRAEPPEPPKPTPTVAVEARPLPAEMVPVPRRSVWGDVGLGAQAALGAGLLPALSWGFGAKLAVGASTRGELGFLYWPGRDVSTSSSGLDPLGGRLQLISGSAWLCQSWGRRPLAGCAGLDVGRMTATGKGVPTIATGASWWLAPGLAVEGWVVPASWLSVRLRAGAGVPVFRPSFVLEHIDPTGPVQVFRPAAIFGALSLEAEFNVVRSTDSARNGH
jgi:hypothetical protein